MNQLNNKIVSGLKRNKRNVLLIVLLLIAIQFSYSQTGYFAGSPKLAFWELGDSNEKTIILHGGPAVEHSYLRPEWDTLSSISKIYYYDQRGSGKSDTAQSYTWIDHVQDLKRIKEIISKNDKIILAGSSWGAELALLYSIYYPDDLKAIILSGFCGWPGMNPKKIDFNDYVVDSLYSFKRNENISNYEDSIRNSKRLDYKEFFKRVNENANPEKELQKRITTNFGNKKSIIGAQTKNSRKSAPDINYLKNINVPILVFGGNLPCTYQDWSDVMENLNDRTQRILIENSCHDPWFTHPEQFFQECFKFIDNLNDNKN
ncbi:alpha/beta fold hydrolase [Maribellus sediminis]|uniref:alpha/beta fold hydrolase n=1 Tax=Maribellus sediminis TaxID=2696285 RepID=UPI001430B18C|nr:alpha/beta hydrolase [Maribellus sediminis]